MQLVARHRDSANRLHVPSASVPVRRCIGRQLTLDPNRVVFIDETRAKTNMSGLTDAACEGRVWRKRYLRSLGKDDLSGSVAIDGFRRSLVRRRGDQRLALWSGGALRSGLLAGSQSDRTRVQQIQKTASRRRRADHRQALATVRQGARTLHRKRMPQLLQTLRPPLHITDDETRKPKLISA